MLIGVGIAVCIILVSTLLYIILKSPFSYPYFVYKFDVSGKRGPQIEDFLDEFLIANGFAYIQSHQKKIDKWKQDSQRQINQSILKKYRQRQYVQALGNR